MRLWVLIIKLTVIMLAARGQEYYLNGTAFVTADGCYAVTSAIGWQNGTVWYSEQLSLSESFTLEFTMNYGNLDDMGADGMVFVLQTVGTSAMGNAGGGLGFEGFNPSFGIEFDTYQNIDMGDPWLDHVAFMKNGSVNHNSSDNLAGPVQANSGSANIEDGQEHIIRIVWNHENHTIQLNVDCEPTLEHEIDLVNEIFGGDQLVYWGFTGATGGLYNMQTICLQDYVIYENEDAAVCEGESVQLYASGNPQGQFEWTPTEGLDDPFSQTPVATPDATTEYCCNYTDLCGSTTITCATVTVESPAGIDAGPDTSFCEGQSVQLLALSDNTDASAVWSTSDGNITSGGNTLQPVVNAEGTYTLTLTTPIAGCISQDVVFVSQIPLPVAGFQSPVYLCPDSIVLLEIEGNFDEVNWFDGSNELWTIANQEGVFQVAVIADGCQADYSISVEQVILPGINLGPDLSLCSGETITLEATASGTWSDGTFGDELMVSSAGSFTFTYEENGCITGDTVLIEVVVPLPIELGADIEICPGQSVELISPLPGLWNTAVTAEVITVNDQGTYSITVEQGPCIITDSVLITMLDQPAVNLGTDITICQGEKIEIGPAYNPAFQYEWTTGDTSSQIEVTTAGDFEITVSNECGAATDSVFVQLEECSHFIYAPNAFTPNEDGVNDVFAIQTYNILHAELIVFNRWGEVVFETQDLANAWTGNHRAGGYYAPNGVYDYLLQYQTPDGLLHDLTGHVVLIR